MVASTGESISIVGAIVAFVVVASSIVVVVTASTVVVATFVAVTALLSLAIVDAVTVNSSDAIATTMDGVSVVGEEDCGGGILGIDLLLVLF